MTCTRAFQPDRACVSKRRRRPRRPLDISPFFSGPAFSSFTVNDARVFLFLYRKQNPATCAVAHSLRTQCDGRSVRPRRVQTPGSGLDEGSSRRRPPPDCHRSISDPEKNPRKSPVSEIVRLPFIRVHRTRPSIF